MELSAWLPKCLHWPFCPGVFIAILAVVAAIAAFRDSPSRPEKAIWTLVFLLLMSAEIVMIGKDRDVQDTRQGTLLTNTAATADRSLQAVYSITGGDSFSYVDLNAKRNGLVINSHGQYALTALHVVVAIDKDAQRQFDFPVLTPHLQKDLYSYRFSPTDHDIAIVFNAVNGLWYETLQTTQVNSKLVSALRVLKIDLKFLNPDRLDTVTTSEEFCRVDEGYPLVNGLVEWHEHMLGLGERIKLGAVPCTRH